MANRIFGFITDSSRGGMPLGDLRVQVWDQDWPDGDDLLGEAFTDPHGRYEVRYQAEAWEGSAGIFDFGRPDIYITVENQNSAGKWVRLGESDVHRNRDLRQDLGIDLALSQGKVTSRRTDFNPEVHGFHFINSFLVKPDILGIDLGEWNMGFCGGMCAGALDRFNKAVPISKDDSSPGDDTSLYTELMKRQVKAMSLKLLSKMFRWQGSPDSGHNRRKQGIGERTRKGWPALKESLDEGKPAMIVLVRAAGLLGNPTDNHQVLATGYDFDPLRMDLVLHVYDPNKPDQPQTISLNLGLPDGNLDLVDSASPKTRGFFVNPAGEEALGIGLA